MSWRAWPSRRSWERLSAADQHRQAQPGLGQHARRPAVLLVLLRSRLALRPPSVERRACPARIRMNSGVSALRVATRSWPASSPERPARDLCLDRGGLGLGGAKAVLDGDQVPRGQRQMRVPVRVIFAGLRCHF